MIYDATIIKDSTGAHSLTVCVCVRACVCVCVFVCVSVCV